MWCHRSVVLKLPDRDIINVASTSPSAPGLPFEIPINNKCFWRRLFRVLHLDSFYRFVDIIIITPPELSHHELSKTLSSQTVFSSILPCRPTLRRPTCLLQRRIFSLASSGWYRRCWNDFTRVRGPSRPRNTSTSWTDERRPVGQSGRSWRQ
jgi:hypothetical protein